MLFVCLLDMPYGYYQLVRFTAMGVFGCLAFVSFERQERAAGYVYDTPQYLKFREERNPEVLFDRSAEIPGKVYRNNQQQ